LFGPHFKHEVLPRPMKKKHSSPGPYAEDAMSIIERIKFEKLDLTRQTMTQILQALHDAVPPQVIQDYCFPLSHHTIQSFDTCKLLQ
jgi:hypothetical protein